MPLVVIAVSGRGLQRRRRRDGGLEIAGHQRFAAGEAHARDAEAGDGDGQ